MARPRRRSRRTNRALSADCARIDSDRTIRAGVLSLTRARLRAASFPGRLGTRLDGGRRDGNSRPGQESLRSGAQVGRGGPVFASIVSARVSGGQTGAHAHRDHSRCWFRSARWQSIWPERIFGDSDACKVLVLGAGETSERTARALVSRGVNDLRVSNRSPERAEDLAARRRRAGGAVRAMANAVPRNRHPDYIDVIGRAAAHAGKSRADVARACGSSAFHHRHRSAARCRSGRERNGRRLSLRHRFVAIDRRSIARHAPPANRRRGKNHRRARGRFWRGDLTRIEAAPAPNIRPSEKTRCARRNRSKLSASYAAHTLRIERLCSARAGANWRWRRRGLWRKRSARGRTGS